MKHNIFLNSYSFLVFIDRILTGAMVEETTNLPIPVDKDLRPSLDFVIWGDEIYVHAVCEQLVGVGTP